MSEPKPPQRRAHRAPAPLEVQSAIANLVAIVGAKRAAGVLHISPPSLARAQRGEPLNPSTAVLLRINLRAIGFLDERPYVK